MRSYLYRCPDCGRRWASDQPSVYREWCGCGAYASAFPVRDYRAEGVGIDTSNLRDAR